MVRIVAKGPAPRGELRGQPNPFHGTRDDCYEAGVHGYPVHFYKGASVWRVCVLGDGPSGDGRIRLITPHVFETPEAAHAWLVDWFDGTRLWDGTWGPAPEWPSVSTDAIGKVKEERDDE